MEEGQCVEEKDHWESANTEGGRHKRSSFCTTPAKKIAKSAACGVLSYNFAAVASSRQSSSYQN